MNAAIQRCFANKTHFGVLSDLNKSYYVSFTLFETKARHPVVDEPPIRQSGDRMSLRRRLRRNRAGRPAKFRTDRNSVFGAQNS